VDFNLVNLVITVDTANVASLLKWLQRNFNEISVICKNGVCRWPARTCDLCSGREMCAWYLVFGQKLSADPSALKRHQKPPLPFIFSFPALENPCGKPDLLDCGLVVIGRAIPHLEMLLDGFRELLTHDTCPVPAKVVRVGSRDYQGAVQALGNGGGISRPDELAVLSAEVLLNTHPWDCTELGIRLLSPLRLLEGGRPHIKFDFSRFARSVMRRVSSLAYYYGEYEIDCDFRALSAQSDAIVCVEDHFSREACGDWKTAGISGHGKFHGDFSGLMPFLVLGTYVHVGKGAAFGMGRYEIVTNVPVSSP